VTDQAVIHTVEHGEASDLPENNWFWRRLFVWAVTVFASGMAFFISQRINDISTLRWALRFSFYTIWLCMVLYMCGATTERLTELMAALRSTRKETITTAPPPATITSTPGGTQVSTDDDGALPPDKRVKR
jgi:hypothetical protein